MKLSRRVSYILCLFVCCCIFIAGCGKKESRVPNTKKSVEAVLQEQIEKEEKNTEIVKQEKIETTEQKEEVTEVEKKNTEEIVKTTEEKQKEKERKSEALQDLQEIEKEEKKQSVTDVENTEEKKEKKEKIKEKEIKNSEKNTAKKTASTEQVQKKVEVSKAKENKKNKEEMPKKEQSSSKIDYDLTKMNSDMIYATVYQMMIDPDSYIGKTVKMKGLYYASYNELNDKYYHFVVVADAAACCSQGIEFVWDRGQHIYPDEYPLDETEVEVVGTFEGYQEEGEDNTYYRLRNSTFHIVE